MAQELEDAFVKEAIRGINYGLRTRPYRYNYILEGHVDEEIHASVSAQFILDEQAQYASLREDKEAMERVKARIRQAIFDLTMSQ